MLHTNESARCDLPLDCEAKDANEHEQQHKDVSREVEYILELTTFQIASPTVCLGMLNQLTLT